MDNPDEETSPSPANVVGIDAKGVCLPRVDNVSVPFGGDAPTVWKDACRTLLTLYSKDPATTKRGKTKTPSSIRDEIMEDFDIYDQEGNRVDRDRNLSRQVFEHWLKSGTDINQTSFRYIDRFVRRLQMGAWYRSAFHEITRHRRLFHKACLLDLYGTRCDEDLKRFENVLRAASGKLYVSPPLSRVHDHLKDMYSGDKTEKFFLSIYIRNIELYVADVAAIYTARPVGGLSGELVAEEAVFHGYITPLEVGRDKSRYKTQDYFILHLFVREETGIRYKSSTSIAKFSSIKDQIFLYWHRQICDYSGTFIPGRDMFNDEDFSRLDAHMNVDGALAEYLENLRDGYLLC